MITCLGEEELSKPEKWTSAENQ